MNQAGDMCVLPPPRFLSAKRGTREGSAGAARCWGLAGMHDKRATGAASATQARR